MYKLFESEITEYTQIFGDKNKMRPFEPFKDATVFESFFGTTLRKARIFTLKSCRE